MNTRTRMALIFSLITVLSMSFISSFSFGDIDKKLTVNLVGKDGLFQEKKEFSISELETNEGFKKDIEKERKYNLNEVESDDDIKDINAKGISIEVLLTGLGINKDEIKSIEFKDKDNEVFTKTKEELFSEKFYFKEDSEKTKVDTIIAISDDYKKTEIDKKDAFTFLQGLTEEEYNNKKSFYKKNIKEMKILLLKDIPKEEEFKILGDREIKIDSQQTDGIDLSTNLDKENYLYNEIKWESSDPNKVKVDENGKIHYVSDGEVTITAIYKYRDKELRDSIIVNKTEEPKPPVDDPSVDPNPTPPSPSPSGGNVLDDSDISDSIIEVTIDDNQGGSNTNRNNTNRNNTNTNTNIRRNNSSTNRSNSGYSSGTDSSRNTSSRRRPSSTSSRNSGSSSSPSSSRRSGTIRRITRSTTSRDNEDEDSQDEVEDNDTLVADRGRLRDSDDERVALGESKWRVYEVEQKEKEMPKLNLTGEMNPIVMIALAVIVIIGGVQKYIKYLGSI